MQTLALAFCLAALPAIAAETYDFSLLPASGNITGAPGSTDGWGYSIHNASSTFWLVTTGLNSGTFLDATPKVIFDFPDLAPGATVTLPYRRSTHAGLFEITWGPATSFGFTNAGTFDLSAQWWNGNPLTNGSFVSQAPTQSQAYTAVAVTTPEPGTAGLISVVLVALVTSRRRSNSRKLS